MKKFDTWLLLALISFSAALAFAWAQPCMDWFGGQSCEPRLEFLKLF